MLSHKFVRTFAASKVMLAWGCWSIFSLGCLIASNSLSLAGVYLIYLIVVGASLHRSISDILSPTAFTIAYFFLGFGSLIPVAIQMPKVFGGRVSENLLFNCCLLVIVAQLGILIGVAFFKYKTFSVKLLRRRDRDVDLRSANLLIWAFVVVGGLLRYQFHIGEAGAPATIPFAGVLYFIIRDGGLLLATWALVRSLRTTSTTTILSCISACVMLAGVDATMGWRGGIFRIALVIFGVFWFQRADKRISFKPRPVQARSFRWLLVIALSGIFVFSMAQTVRMNRLGSRGIGVSRSSNRTPIQFAEAVWLRAQGLTRLYAVVRYVGGELSPTNDFYITEALETGFTASLYVDRHVHGISKSQFNRHGVGASGPGTTYVYGGILGVFVGYAMLGALLAVAYRSMVRSDPGNSIFIVLYVNLLPPVLTFVTENFDLLALKQLLFIVGTSMAMCWFLTRPLGQADLRRLNVSTSPARVL